ncbi:MAG: preprotein translocase subunit SecY [Ruminococcaceae bacterium]|nr:preprotein translocase subunit SecY [Oscillospiraceae bacterium]
MFQTIRNAWKIPDLRKKILFTLFMIAIFRLGSYIPVPGLDRGALQSMIGEGNNLFGMLDLFSGGAFGNATIFAMSITPYINSSIIMQLLTVAIPALERMAKEGEEGRKKIAAWTRYGTVILAFIQATGLYIALRNGITNPGVLSFILITFSFTAGTAFLMWLGEQITENGVGNGISIIIFAGIVSRLPSDIVALVANFRAAEGIGSVISLIAVILVSAISIILVVFINDAERRIPVQYAKRMVGRKMYGGQSTHIPIKVAMAGVIPIIFAMSILSFPQTIAQFMGSTKQIFNPTSWIYIILYFVLIIFFTYFYTAIQFNPIEVANNMKKNGGFVPGIRPGKPTSDFINRVLVKITLAGAVFLGLIAVAPQIVAKYTMFQISLAGSSLLILVGVALETVKQIESQMLMRHYKGFLD